ncbi:hypothetical protein DUNSADRAFT_290 [Dunaliella salina]|uniref:Uncharacterized protein n=1 Tax=Dunaliella salina TaxID=3046 RepID=A0ABQ7GYF2_DUNSA|nr:hypothetical protein DUNSADRAFT_290 [Dunaliella salina]|eukprot:KAF5839634.1 hypothetical protein DUNSADRAFT_290 [Dunaliella salina]
MGYDVEPSMSGLEESLLLPRVEYSCLTIFERALLYQGCFLARSKPKLYSQMLNVIYLLATTPISSVPILEYLSPKNNPLLVNLKEVLGQPLPDTEQTYECAASLHQLSWIMRLQEPYLADIPAEERRLQAEMSVNDVSVEALIAHPHVQTALGIHMRSDTGDILFDVAALFPLLVQRYEQYVARGGQAGPAAAEAPATAIRGALRYVQHFNAYALLSGAQAAVAEAWLQLTQHFNAYVLLVGAPQAAVAEAWLQLTQVTRRLLTTVPGTNSDLSPLMVNVARILLSKLQEQAVVNVSMGQSADPLALVRAPHRCHELLRLLLELLALSRRVQPTLLAAHARGSRRAVFVIEAQLGLLLQLGQSGPSPRVRQLAAQSLSALQPLQHLAGCRALDVEPEDPGSVPGPVGSGQMDTLRFRLQHLMAPTLRLVLAIVAPLPESNAVRHDARLFVGAHYRALDRVLREAASPGNFNWTPGDSELEQAELVTSLLSRLVPVWAELGPTQAEGLRHALFRLALAFCCLDTKSTSPIVKSLHTLSPHPGQASPNRTALVSRALRVASLRAVLARFLRDLVAHHQHHPIQGGATSGASLGDGHGGAGAPLRCLGPGPRPEYDPHTARPTLMLVRDMAEQATVDAGAALDELEGLLGLLRMPDRALDDATCAEKLVWGAAAVAAAEDSAGLEGVSGAGGLGGLLARRRLARHYLALAASQLDTLLGKDMFILEHSLAIIVLHFVRYLPRPLASAPGAASAAAGGGGGMAQGAFQPSLGGSEEMLMDAAAASLSATGGGQQQGEVGAGPLSADAAALGSSADLAYFVSRLQETCLHAEELLGKVSDLAGGGPEQLAGTPAATSGPGPTGSRHMLRLEGIDLMVRTLKSYCASF